MKTNRTFSLVVGLALGLAAAANARSADNGAEPLILDLSSFQSEEAAAGNQTNAHWKALAGRPRQVFDAVPFQVDGRAWVYGSKLGAEKRGGTNIYPDLIGIKVGRKFDELLLLHTTKGADLEGQEIARIRLNYADRSKHEFPILFGGQVREAQQLASEEKELLADSNTKVVWRVPGDTANKPPERLFKTVLANPHPQQLVATVDVISSRHRAAYWLLAATVANRDPKRPVTTPQAVTEPPEPFDGTLTVRVTRQSSGEPIAGALVDPSMKIDGVFADGVPVLTSTGGEAVIRYPAARTARIVVMVEKEGYDTQRGVAKLNGATTGGLRVKLLKAENLTGIVRDSSGALLEGVEVMAWPEWRTQSKPVTTDASGQFVLPWHPQNEEGPNSDILLMARDLKKNLALAQAIDEQTTNVDLRLQPGLTLAGRATDAKGKALTNATAELILQTDRMATPLGKSVRVDAEGRFEIKALPPGQRYHVSVSAKGFGRVSRNLEQEAEGRRIELEPCALALADRQIAGVVLDSDDKPVSVADVHAYGEGQPMLSGKSDTKGQFSFKAVCAGPLTVQANTRKGLYGSVVAHGGDTNITVKLGEQENVDTPSRGGVKITGKVIDQEGKPAPKARVSLAPSFSQSEKQTDPDGRFTLMFDPRQFGGMGGSTPTVLARDVGRNLAAAVELEEGATNVTVRLEPALMLTGRITDQDGKTVTNAQAQVWMQAGRMGASVESRLKADTEGRFDVKALPAGREYTVMVSAKGFGQEQQHVAAADVTTNRIELEAFQLIRADQRIAGVVVDDDDKPVAHASIYSYGNKQPNLNAQTDSKGQFSMNKVCPGPIQLSANSPRGVYGNVTAEGGDTNIIIRVSSSPGIRRAAPQVARLKGKPLPDLTQVGLTAADAPADQTLLAMLIDAEQRPSRRALRLLGEQAAALKEKGVAVLVVQTGTMADDAFKAWKQEAASPFPVGCFKGDAEKARVAWGAGALPWLILTDKAHRVTAEGFDLDELDAKVKAVAQ